MSRNIFLFAIKLLISAALIAFLATKLDLDQINAKLSDLRWLNIAIAGLIFMLLQMSNALRWNVVLSAIDRSYSFLMLFKVQNIGSFFNQTLPSVIGGDALRMYTIHKSGASLITAVNGIVLERVITVACLIFMVTLAQPFMDLPADKTIAQYIFPILSLLAILGTVVLTQLDRFPPSMNRLKIVRGMGNLAVDAKILFTSVLNIAKSLFFGLLGNTLISLFAWQCALALGIDLSIIEALVLVPPAILIATLPISIAGWGVREGAMVTTLSMAGIAEIDAFTMSILFGLLMAAFSIPGGIAWLLHRNKQ
jgi:glycosyltransferase 2 family protein